MKKKSVVQSSMSMVAMTVKTMDVLIEIANGQIQQMKRRRRHPKMSVDDLEAGRCPRCGGDVIEYSDGKIRCEECGWEGEE